jgi:cytidylate kinase
MGPTSTEDDVIEPDEGRGSPRHGDPGDRRPPPAIPAALSVALSREAGARGGATGRRVGRKLGWQVYDQELLEYLALEGTVRQGVLEALTPAAAAWVEERMERLLREQHLSQHPSVVNLARVVLTIAAQGEAVLIGRGAGFLLPRETTLNVRMIAPLNERVAYLSQWLRLSEEEAAEKVRQRDERRAEFLRTYFRRDPADVHQYDLLLNASQLGEDVCAELIAQAARARASQMAGWT